MAAKTILTLNPENALHGWPKEWTTPYFNGGGDACDMLAGPCACGGWHSPEEWSDKHFMPRKINGVAVLDFYNAQWSHIPQDRHNPVRETEPLSLSYF